MGAWLDGQLKGLGVTTKLVDLGKHIMDGHELPLPPAILGRIGDDPKKKTVLIYGHYDVQPVCCAQSLPELAGGECASVGGEERRVGYRAIHAGRRRQDR